MPMYQPEIETMSPEQIRKLQSERLVKQVRHVYDNVPYYRAKMEEKGITPEDIDVYKRQAMNRAEYLRSVGLEADETCVVAGIAARLNPVKDIATLIRGFAKAYRAFPALRLLAVYKRQ